VRNKGEQIKKGNIALKKGSYLDSASLGFLASLGINKVKVYNLPRVSIIVTGNEFVKSRRKLSKGKIYESNGLMLKSLLKDMNIHSQSRLCKDDLTGLTLLIKKEIDKNDIIIISGGVSVGDYDFTEKALKKLKFNIIFYKVYQKPGKPLLFAKRKNKTVFGLPGNPRSALMCFYEYVYPYILASMGNKKPLLLSAALPLVHNYIKNEEKTLFMTSKLTDKGINILEGQDSHMLKSFSEADTIVCLTEGKKNYTAGELVTVHFLPG
jgi:molybdopterin molybdotransferase